MEKKINLVDILTKQIECNFPSFEFLKNDTIPYLDCIKAMKEACRQTLELAAEGVSVYNYSDNEDYSEYVDKQSILNVIKYIE